MVPVSGALVVYVHGPMIAFVMIRHRVAFINIVIGSIYE